MRAFGIAVGAFIAVAGVLLIAAPGITPFSAALSAAFAAAIVYLSVLTRSMADLATVEKLRHEIPKLQAECEKLRLEIQQLQKTENRIKPASDAEVIQFSVGELFKRDPPSKW